MHLYSFTQSLKGHLHPLEVLSIETLLTNDLMSPIVNPVGAFTNQGLQMSSPEHLPDFTYLFPEDPSPWNWHQDPTHAGVVIPSPLLNLPVIFSGDDPVPAEMDYVPLFTDFDAQQRARESLLTLSGTGGQNGGIPSPDSAFACRLDPSVVNAALDGQNSLHGPLNVVLSAFALLAATYLPQVRSLIFMVADVVEASSI